MGEYKGYLVQPKDIHRIWGHIEPLIQDSNQQYKRKREVTLSWYS